MPSTYAHFRLGKEVRELLDGDIKEAVDAYPQLFMIGLHGPDILFYYKPLASNCINRVGYHTHEIAGRDFFMSAAEVVRKHDREKAYLAYTYGFICHFALDSTCHGYIDEKINESGISHTEIEVEFDRKLMVMDGHDPVKHKLTEHIVASRKNARVIKEFFGGISEENVEKALEEMVKYNNLLVAPSRVKRQFIYALLRISGNYKEMHGLLVNYQKNPECSDSNVKLMGLYKQAVKLSVQLIREFTMYMDGKCDLHECYRYTFGSKLPDEDVEKNMQETKEEGVPFYQEQQKREVQNKREAQNKTEIAGYAESGEIAG